MDALQLQRPGAAVVSIRIVKLISLIIFNEEKIFRESFAAAIGLQNL